VTSKYVIFTSTPEAISHLDVTNRMKGGIFLGQLSNFQPIKNGSAQSMET
jgi:hypothetical protein